MMPVFEVAREAKTSLAHIAIGHHGPQTMPWCAEVLESSHMLEMAIEPRPGGTGCYDFGGSDVAGTLGEIYYRPAGRMLRRSAGHSTQAIRCTFDENRLERMFGCRGEWSTPALRQSLDIRSAPIRSQLLRIVRETGEPGLAGDVLLESLIIEVAVELARYFYDKVEHAHGGLAGWQVRRIHERVRGDLASPPTLEELADLCGISERHLMRGFKQSSGRTIGRFMEEVRLSRAQHLLTIDDMPLKQVAHALGYANAASFSSAFRRGTGMTPSSFRQRGLS